MWRYTSAANLLLPMSLSLKEEKINAVINQCLPEWGKKPSRISSLFKPEDENPEQACYFTAVCLAF